MFTNLPLIAAVFARCVVAVRNAAKYTASGTLKQHLQNALLSFNAKRW
jgi:hypothetical protein